MVHILSLYCGGVSHSLQDEQEDTMPSRKLDRRTFLRSAALMGGTAVGAAALAACGATPTPQVVEKVVTSVVEKEVTKIVEGTAQVVKETVVVESTVVVEKEVTVQAAPAQKITLRYLFDDTPGERMMHKVNKVDYEEAHPDVVIQPEPVPDGFEQKVYAAVVAGTSWDILIGWTENFVGFRSKGVFQDITDTVKSWPDLDDFWPAAFNEMALFEGKYYGVPYCYDPVTMEFYHKSLFDEAGLAYPNDKWTYDDLKADAIALTKKDASGNVIQWGYDASDTYYGGGFRRAFTIIWAFGGRQFSDDFKHFMFGEKEAMDAINWLYDVEVTNGCQPTPEMKGSINDAQLFASGKAAITNTGPWDIATYQEMIQDEKLKSQWDIFGPPTGPKGRFMWTVGNDWGVWSGSKYKKEATDLLYWLTDKDRAKLIGSVGKRTPSRKSAAASFVTPGKPDNQIAFPDALSYAFTPPYHPTLSAKVRDIVIPYWESIFLTRKRTPEEAMKLCVADVDKLLAEG
jgi:multiple sugar transport system substrate-binding protein